MAWFTPDTLDFLRELELNNNREWFAENRKRYEQSLKEPMHAFAAALIERMKELYPKITMDAKGSVFRIHRDTRFSKGKDPYKTNAALVVTDSFRGDHARPGLYFHFDPRVLAIAGGLYMPDRDQLHAVRTHIANHLEEFEKLLVDEQFTTVFGGMQGEKNKIAPAEFKPLVERQPMILNKQFFYWSEQDAEEILREDLLEFVMIRANAAYPLNRFLRTALGVEV